MRYLACPTILCIMAALCAHGFGGEVPVRSFETYRLPDAFLFAQGFAHRGERPVVCDVDADGFADLVRVGVGDDGRIECVANEDGQQAHGQRRLATFGQPTLLPGMAVDNFGNGRPSFIAIAKGGQLVRAAWQRGGEYKVTEIAQVPERTSPQRLCAGDADGDGLEDLFLVVTAGDGQATEAYVAISKPDGSHRGFALWGAVHAQAHCGDLNGDRQADFAWLSDGNLVAVLGVSGTSKGRSQLWASGIDGALLALADGDGDGRSDLVCTGSWYLNRAEALVRFGDKRLEPVAHTQVAAGDTDGDGCDDVVLFASGGRRDVNVALSRLPGWYQRLGVGLADTDGDGLVDAAELLVHRTDPFVRDTDHDGLLDGWEVRGTRGVRLQDMGASPLRRDLFLELDADIEVSVDRIQEAIEVMEDRFARGPIRNPDGSTGIRVHCLVDTHARKLDPKGPSRYQLREMYFTPQRAGLFHWMYLSGGGGGGQANLLSDHGICGGHFPATLIHEFGHQLGLQHGGDTSLNGVPHYSSLMNYAYNYQRNGKADLIDFSAGAVSAMVLDENALEEMVPYAPETLAFLAGPPFHFQVAAVAAASAGESQPNSSAPSSEHEGSSGEQEGNGSAALAWIDWNRNGVRDTKPVRANINATKGEGYGPRDVLDEVDRIEETTTTVYPPLLLAVPGSDGSVDADDAALLLAYIPKQEGAGGLAVRVLVGDRPVAFSASAVVTKRAGLTSICGAVVGRIPTVIASGSDGLFVYERQGEETDSSWAETSVALPELPPGRWVTPALTTVVPQGEPLLWVLALREAETGGIALLSAKAAAGPWALAPGYPSYCARTPVDLAWDSVHKQLLVAHVQSQSDKRPWRLRLSRVDVQSWKTVGSEWVGGNKGGDSTTRRPALLFATAPWLPAEGEINVYHAGIVDAEQPNLHMYRSYTIGDRNWRKRQGWKEDQTWNEWSYSRDAPTAAWYRGRPWQATRFYTHYDSGKRWNDHIAIAPNADGICDRNMRDVNDWELMERVGIPRSILQRRVPRGQR